MNNYENIKNMTIEQLKSFLCEINDCRTCAAKDRCEYMSNGWLNYLKDEVKEGYEYELP